MLKSKKRGIQDVAHYTGGRPSASSSFNPDPRDDDVMSSVGFAAAVIVGFIIIAFLAVRFGTAGIEADLEAKARQALTTSGFTEVNVDARGTSLRLSGSITTEQTQDEAYAAVSGITGVGSVGGALWPVFTGDLEEIVVTGEAIDITWNGDEAIVSGSVSSTEKVAFVNQTLSSTFTNGVDIAGLSALEGLEDETTWLGTTLSLVQRFADALPAGRVVVDPSAKLLTVVGETEDKALRDELNDLATETGAGFGFAVTTGVRLLVLETPPTDKEVEELQINLDDLIEGKVVEFEVKSYALTSEGEALLDEISAALESVPNVRVRISGHTDSQGSHEDNQVLSELRARTVLEYLVAKGADQGRFEMVGLGESEPIADNTTAEGRARNRRIEFTALLEEG
ncbi:hypothetical protein MNBD_ACTINO01-2594 [hydrothermal vent metagenome]|uniref:OmpA-like domain-containing protein n=1 Tax=hydrothermal vent metagenome TaxID=652676 RepID=A0A3B0RWF8_9ZZZZ